MAALRQAGGTLSFDINLRPQMWSNEMQMFDLVSEFARQSDILKMSEEELLWLTQTDCLSSACERWLIFRVPESYYPRCRRRYRFLAKP